MHSAAGLAAAAAAIQSSSGLSSDSQHPANSMASEQNRKSRMGTPGNITSNEEASDMKDKPTYTLPDSSSNVVSSTMDEDDISSDYGEPKNSQKNGEKSKKAKVKVITK